VKAWGPDEIVLLPLYPQYSTTTTRSSVALWRSRAAAAGLDAPTRVVCCYPTEPGFTAAVASLVRRSLADLPSDKPPRILFSAHGLPKKVVASGDPYQWQVEESVAAVVRALALPDLDHVICYQSRVGPLEWIGPSTDSEVARAGAEGVPVVVVPIAFVSEHSETLVELDIEYRHLATEKGVPAYRRVPTVGTAPEFIAGLAGLVRRSAAGKTGTGSGSGGRLCPRSFGRCACDAG
jgi:ferrochelatase